MPIDQMLGPDGLVVGLLAAVGALWWDHRHGDAELRKDRNDWRDIALASQTDTGRLTAAVERVLDIKVPPR